MNFKSISNHSGLKNGTGRRRQLSRDWPCDDDNGTADSMTVNSSVTTVLTFRTCT